MGNRTGMGSHHSSNSITTTWITPKHIFQPLGRFDLDPCVPKNAPWLIAAACYCLPEQDGLALPWHGRVWLNPPYNALDQWMQKIAGHGNGIALTYARTETKTFQNWIFPFADTILFLKGRITFCDITGKAGAHNGGAPSVLISYGEQNAQALAESRLAGRHIMVNAQPVIVVGVNPSWKCVIKIAITRLNGQAHVQDIYDMVEIIAPGKVEKNSNYKEKIRQKLQAHCIRVSRGVYTTTIS